MLSTLLLALSGPAIAGEIEIYTPIPAQVTVDGRKLSYGSQGLVLKASDLQPGNHVVQVRNVMGRFITESVVAVAADEQVRMIYQNKQLSETGRISGFVSVTVVDGSQSATVAAAPADPTQASASQSVTVQAGGETVTVDTTVHGGFSDPAAASTSGFSGATATTSTGGFTDPAAAPTQQAGGFSSPTATQQTTGYTETVQVGVGAGAAGVNQSASMTVSGSYTETTSTSVNGVGYTESSTTTFQGGGADAAVGMTASTTATGDSVSMGVQVDDGMGGTENVSINMNIGGLMGAAPVAAAPAAAPACPIMDSGSVSRLRSAVDNESFSDDQLDLLRTAASGNSCFTCAQVGQLIDPLSFDSDKVEAVSILRPKIADPENAYSLNQHFSFSSDKEKVQAMFR